MLEWVKLRHFMTDMGIEVNCTKQVDYHCCSKDDAKWLYAVEEFNIANSTLNMSITFKMTKSTFRLLFLINILFPIIFIIQLHITLKRF